MTVTTIGSRRTRQDLVRWSEALAGIARTGLGFTQSLYEQERFEEVLHVAGDIRASLAADAELDVEHYVDEWMRSVGEGVAGYVTPKSAIGAVVYDDEGRILLVQRADSGVWLYPTGWADVGYSPAEVAVKEVLEETGIDCVPEGVIAVLDGMRMGITRIPLYSTVFLLPGHRRRAHGPPARDERRRVVRRGRAARDDDRRVAVGRPRLRRHPRRAGVGAVRPAPSEALAPVLTSPPCTRPPSRSPSRCGQGSARPSRCSTSAWPRSPPATTRSTPSCTSTRAWPAPPPRPSTRRWRAATTPVRSPACRSA